MSTADVLFLCPAYRPDSVEQAHSYIEGCEHVANELGWSLQVLQESLVPKKPGSWHRHLHRDETHNIFSYKYLWAIRGGFGSVYWVEKLLNEPRQHAPYLIGYSDLSIWHCVWRIKEWGETCYGMMPGAPWGEQAISSLQRCVQGQPWAVNEQTHPQVSILRQGTASGPCFASCLRVLSSCVGTAMQPDLNGCILALEDIDEKPYSVERDMRQLLLSGVLDGVQALVIGSMPFAESTSYAGPSMTDVFRSWAEELQIPLIQGLPFGHEKDPLSLPLGRHSILRVALNSWSWEFSQR